MHGGEKGRRKALIRRRCGPVEGEVAPNGEHNEGPVQSVVRAHGRNRFEMERMSPSRCSPRQTTCKDHSPGTSAGIPFARCYIGDRQPVGSPLAGINSQSSFLPRSSRSDAPGTAKPRNVMSRQEPAPAKMNVGGTSRLPSAPERAAVNIFCRSGCHRAPCREVRGPASCCHRNM